MGHDRQINTLLLNSGLIDKVILTLIPVILGQDIPLFEGQTKETSFDLEKSQAYDNGFVQLTLKNKKQ
ncbi:hypothetical protein LCGC14_2105220 [marine sediment metagenome]|uniref:Bacterial bifunctional deaminase-reductase C-terminal domain-containing protein n=1 Tax=marine sediment metagenome TaxID=412755 RepID=A0A0F9A0W5_9ZZZZ